MSCWVLNSIPIGQDQCLDIVDNVHRAYQSCVDNLRRNRERYRAIYDKKLPKYIATLEVGDICLMRNERIKNKIVNRWSAESHESC